MTYDQRGSEVLGNEECLTLLRHAGEAGFIGHLGISREGPPHIIPVNFSFPADEVLIRLGSGFAAYHLDGTRVSFEVDESDPYGHKGWSVLVEGTARQVPYDEAAQLGREVPRPIVMLPGMRVFSIRPAAISGRALRRDYEGGRLGASTSLRLQRLGGPGSTRGGESHAEEGGVVNLHLDNEEATELHRLLSAALGDLSTEIAGTENPAYVRNLRQRRDHLERIERELGSVVAASSGPPRRAGGGTFDPTGLPSAGTPLE